MKSANKLCSCDIFLIISIFMLGALLIFVLNCKVNRFEARQAEAQAIIESTTKADKPITAVDCKQVYYDIPLEKQYQDFVFDMCEKYSVPVNIVLGIMWQESKFDFMAVSKDKQCVGIMQVNRINYDELNKQLGVTDLTNPYQNIESGIYIFSNLLHKYGDCHKALVCYNCGERGAKDLIASKYSIDVMNYAMQLKQL